MEQLLLQLLEKAKKDKRILVMLKTLATESCEYELASKLRDIQKEIFPETGEIIKIKERAKELQTALRAVGVNASESTCFLIDSMIKQIDKRKGTFDIQDALEINMKKEEIFGI